MNTTKEKPIGWLALVDGQVYEPAYRKKYGRHGPTFKPPRKLYRTKGAAKALGTPVPVYLSDCLRRAGEET